MPNYNCIILHTPSTQFLQSNQQIYPLMQQQNNLQAAQEAYKQSVDVSDTYDNSEIRDNISIETLGDPLQTMASTVKNAYCRHGLAMIQHYAEQKRREKNNLAYVMAQRMPPNIRKQVSKMVEYYEGHMEDQLQYIHRLVAENKFLHKKLERLELAENDNKENLKGANENSEASNFKLDYIKVNEQKNQRIEQLESSLIDKNKQIGELNKEITGLYGQVKKYKKKICELEAKSPLKPDRSKSPANLQ